MPLVLTVTAPLAGFVATTGVRVVGVSASVSLASTLMLTGLPAVVVALSGLATGASLMGLMVMLAVAVVLVLVPSDAV